MNLYRIRVPVLVLCTVWFFAGEWLQADVIDRMMAVVDGRVVTRSDLEEYRKIADLFGDSVPGSERGILDQVIENILVQEQIDQFAVIRVREEEVTTMVRQLGDTGDLAADVVRAAARARLMRARYFGRRFVQQASEAEIADYYEDVFVPAAESEGLEPIPPLQDVLELIRNNVLMEKAGDEISVWVESLYRRSEVEVVE